MADKRLWTMCVVPSWILVPKYCLQPKKISAPLHLQVNALFVPDATDYDNTWLGSIGVAAFRDGKKSTTLQFTATGQDWWESPAKTKKLSSTKRRAVHSQGQGSIQSHPKIPSCSGGVDWFQVIIHSWVYQEQPSWSPLAQHWNTIQRRRKQLRFDMAKIE